MKSKKRASKDTSKESSAESFQAFQSNLLSLVSHELRTPLTGVLSALLALQDDTVEESVKSELLSMATRNAQALNQALMTLLDLGALESGTFRLNLREISFSRLFKERSEKVRDLFSSREIKIDIRENSLEQVSRVSDKKSRSCLGDLEKISRVADLLFQVALHWGQNHSDLKVRIGSHSVHFEFKIRKDLVDNWSECWTELSENSFFHVKRQEREFLTRGQEGLGSELFLIAQIAHLHSGRFRQIKSENIHLEFSLPLVEDRAAVLEVLKSRVFSATHKLGITAVAILRSQSNSNLEEFFNQLENALFRATDSVYLLKEEQVCVVLLEDCKPKDAERLMDRIQTAINIQFEFGVSFCPSEGASAEELLGLAQKRLDSKR